jgi:hypothetical protein
LQFFLSLLESQTRIDTSKIRPNQAQASHSRALKQRLRKDLYQ